MEQKKQSMNIGNMVYATERAKSVIKDAVDRANNLTTDPDKKKRIEAQQCAPCFYSSRIGGQAMTNRDCMSCGQTQTYSSTATDVLCKQCAIDAELCKQCGADLKLRVRRKDWPKPKCN